MTYGVTWATEDHSIAQTGYVYATMPEAETVARTGPHEAARTTQVDGMCEHDTHSEKVYGLVQTEHENLAEVDVAAARGEASK